MTSPEVIFTIFRRTRALPYHILKSLVPIVERELGPKMRKGGAQKMLNISIVNVKSNVNEYNALNVNLASVRLQHRLM